MRFKRMKTEKRTAGKAVLLRQGMETSIIAPWAFSGPPARAAACSE